MVPTGGEGAVNGPPSGMGPTPAAPTTASPRPPPEAGDAKHAPYVDYFSASPPCPGQGTKAVLFVEIFAGGGRLSAAARAAGVPTARPQDAASGGADFSSLGP